MKRSVAIAAAAGLVLAGPVVLTMAPAGAAAIGCRAVYTLSSTWSGGFTASIAVTNLGDPINNWVITFDFDAGQQVTQGWNATWNQSAPHVSAASLPWNGSLGTGTSVSIHGPGVVPA
jgi:cellulase/cellobiase CelA1